MGPRLRVISWNVHGTPVAPRALPRLRAVAGEIRRREPDLALLQEVWAPEQARVLQGFLGEAFALAEAPGYPAPGRSGGLLAFVRSASGWSLRELRFEAYRAAAPAWKVWEGDGLAGKGIQSLTLERPGQRLYALNTHLQASYGEGGYTEVRREQLRQLREAALALDPETPLLCFGDLNTRPAEPIFQELADVFSDLSRRLRESCGCSTLPSNRGWIDYALARRASGWDAEAELELIRSLRDDYPYSDHHGLDARVSFTPSSRALALRTLEGPATRRAWLRALATLARAAI